MESYREEFTYDDVGNRTQRVLNSVTTTNTYNARNQLTSSVTGSVTTNYTYDKNGNTLTSSDGTITKTMAYDSLNRMTSWTDGTNSEATTYIGARWHRASYTGGGATKYFLYDGDNVVADLVDDPANPGSCLGSQLYVTPFLDQNLSVTDITTPASPVTRYYSQDRRNSVTTVTTAAGAMANVYDYSAMGEKLAYTHETAAQRYQYTGRELNPVSGEHYFRYRTYSPSTGMFFTRDPLGYVDGPSLYQGYYAMGLDPSGLRAVIIELGSEKVKKKGIREELKGNWQQAIDATDKKVLELLGRLNEVPRMGDIFNDLLKNKAVKFNGEDWAVVAKKLGFEPTLDGFKAAVQRERGGSKHIVVEGASFSEEVLKGGMKKALAKAFAKPEDVKTYDAIGLLYHYSPQIGKVTIGGHSLRPEPKMGDARGKIQRAWLSATKGLKCSLGLAGCRNNQLTFVAETHNMLSADYTFTPEVLSWTAPPKPKDPKVPDAEWSYGGVDKCKLEFVTPSLNKVAHAQR